MDLLHTLIDFVLHIDQHLTELVSQYGTLTYFILFAIIFCETGLVITPILPGDSMLFAAGAIAALGNGLNVHLLVLLMIIAAFTGNMANYFIGRFVGPRVYEKNYKLIRREYVDRTRKFFDKYGAMTIIYTRFAPILRTFAPFIAGVGQMKVSRFILFNLAGGILWVSLFTYAGYFFGNIPFVKQHFESIVIGIILVSLLPAVYAFVKMKIQKKAVSN